MIIYNGVLIRVHQVDEGTHVQVWGIRDLGRGEERSCRRQHGARASEGAVLLHPPVLDILARRGRRPP